MHGRCNLFGLGLLLLQGLLCFETDLPTFNRVQPHLIGRIFKSGKYRIQVCLLGFHCDFDAPKWQVVIGVALCSEIIRKAVFK